MTDTVRHSLQDAAKRLATVSSSPRLDAELLLAHSLEWPRSRLYSQAQSALSPEARAQFLELLAARASGRPVAYLLGRQEFWSLDFELGDDCLVPRPETESLVELALAEPDGPRRVLDLGTGSGVIAIAIKRERPDWEVSAVDCSPGALRWARHNAARHNADVTFLEGRWFEPVSGRRFDLILANPPYIAHGDPHLEALRHEPTQALVAGADGLADIRHICEQASAYLSPGGMLALEHGMDQAAAVRELLQAAGLRDIASERDLAGHERISHGRRP